MKFCASCGEVKPLEAFYFRKELGRHRATCKACFEEKKRAWREANPVLVRAYALRSQTKYQRNNREQYLAKRRVRDALRRADPAVRLARRVSEALRQGLCGKKHRRSWFSLVGYDLESLKAHLERQFLKGMSWENMGEWHIDHIVPLASFTITGPDDPELRRAWALTNLRPLWARDNTRKHARRTHLL